MPAQKYSSPDVVPVKSLTTENENGCWLWNGALANGYPCMRIAGIHYKVHRISYQQVHGDLTDEQIVRHICDTPRCCNPNHLIAGTQKDNARDHWIGKASIGGIHDSGNGYRAKITIRGVLHRKFSLNRKVVEQWLEDKRSTQYA